MKVWLLHVDFFAQTQCSVRDQFQGWCLDEGSRVLLGSGSPSGESRLSRHVRFVLSSKASLSMQIHSSGVDFLQLCVHLFLDLPVGQSASFCIFPQFLTSRFLACGRNYSSRRYWRPFCFSDCRLYSCNDVFIYNFVKLQKLGIYCNFIYL